MHDGAIIQTAPPHEIYSKPANLFAAQFVGEMNFVKATVTGPGQVESLLGPIPVAVPEGVRVGAPVTLAIRPEQVKLNANNGSSTALKGTIASMNYLGDAALIEVEVNGVTLMAKLAGDTQFSVGERIAVELPADRWHVFP